VSKKGGFSLKYYLWSLSPLIIFTCASIADGYNYLVNYCCADSSTITIIDMIEESPWGFLTGAVISGTIVSVILIDDLFIFSGNLLHKLWNKKKHNSVLESQ